MLNHIFGKLPSNLLIKCSAYKQIDENRDNDEWFNTHKLTLEDALNWSKSYTARGYNIFYGVAPRINDKQIKSSCYGVKVVWVDVDNCTDYTIYTSRFILPPSYVVSSGGGYHIYWLLDEYVTDISSIELTLKKLCKCVGGDVGCTDITRMLRIPDTYNHKLKYDSPIKVEIKLDKSQLIYSWSEIQTAVNNNWSSTINRIKEYKADDRSLFDFIENINLVTCGFGISTVENIYLHYSPSNSKANEDRGNYARTMKKIKEIKTVTGEIVEDKVGEYFIENYNSTCYCAINDKGIQVPVSNFMLTVKAIKGGDKSAFLVDIVVGSKVWKDRLLTSKAFNSSTDLRKEIDLVEVVWFGKDYHVYKLNAWLNMQCVDNNLPTIETVSTIGIDPIRKTYSTYEGVYNYDLTKSTNLMFQGVDNRYAKTKLYPPVNHIEVRRILSDVLKLNTEDNMKALLGWFIACHTKPTLDYYNVSFPHMLLSGTKGSGKTTLINHIFQPLMGYEKDQTWPAFSSLFVLDNVFSASTSTPMCLTEFRDDNSKNNNRKNDTLGRIRTAYDGGRRLAGNADKSLTEYRYTSPICIDGEETIRDQATLDRFISVSLNRNVTKGKESQDFVTKVREYDLRGVGATILNYILSLDMETIYNMYKVLLTKYPHLDNNTDVTQRTKTNYPIASLGLELLNAMLLDNENPTPFITDPIVNPPESQIHDTSRLDVIDFMESVIMNSLGDKPDTQMLCKRGDKKGIDTHEFAFHLESCYNWYCGFKQRSGKSEEVKAKSTLRRQLDELDTGILIDSNKPIRIGGQVAKMYVVDLRKVSETINIYEEN